MKKKRKKKWEGKKERKEKMQSILWLLSKKTDWQSDQKDRFFALKFCQLSYALAHVCIFILLYFIYFLTEDRASEKMSCEHSAIFFQIFILDKITQPIYSLHIPQWAFNPHKMSLWGYGVLLVIIQIWDKSLLCIFSFKVYRDILEVFK